MSLLRQQYDEAVADAARYRDAHREAHALAMRYRDEMDRYREALADLLHGALDMHGYVPPYFAEKWDHDAYLSRARDVLGLGPTEWPDADLDLRHAAALASKEGPDLSASRFRQGDADA